MLLASVNQDGTLSEASGAVTMLLEEDADMSGELSQLIRLRNELGLTSADVATEMGLNHSYVRRIEAGDKEPLNFAHRYKVGLIRAILRQVDKGARYFGTHDLVSLLKALSPDDAAEFVSSLASRPPMLEDSTEHLIQPKPSLSK